MPRSSSGGSRPGTRSQRWSSQKLLPSSLFTRPGLSKASNWIGQNVLLATILHPPFGSVRDDEKIPVRGGFLDQFGLNRTRVTAQASRLLSWTLASGVTAFRESKPLIKLVDMMVSSQSNITTVLVYSYCIEISCWALVLVLRWR